MTTEWCQRLRDLLDPDHERPIWHLSPRLHRTAPPAGNMLVGHKQATATVDCPNKFWMGRGPPSHVRTFQIEHVIGRDIP